MYTRGTDHCHVSRTVSRRDVEFHGRIRETTQSARCDRRGSSEPGRGGGVVQPEYDRLGVLLVWYQQQEQLPTLHLDLRTGQRFSLSRRRSIWTVHRKLDGVALSGRQRVGGLQVQEGYEPGVGVGTTTGDRKSTRLN